MGHWDRSISTPQNSTMGSWLNRCKCTEEDANAPPPPAAACRCTALSAQELYNLQADLHSFCLILDLRPAAQFNQWHLDQAVSLPGATTEQALELAAARPYTHLVLCAPGSCIKLCTVQGPCCCSKQEMFEGPATVQEPCLLISE